MTLANMHCAAGGQATKLDDAAITTHLATLPGWQRTAGINNDEIHKTFAFQNYHETMAFVNASAWVSHAEDHHPDMGVHYNRCVVSYSTHDAGGITLNDFICAAKLDALIAR